MARIEPQGAKMDAGMEGACLTTRKKELPTRLFLLLVCQDNGIRHFVIKTIAGQGNFQIEFVYNIHPFLETIKICPYSSWKSCVSSGKEAYGLIAGHLLSSLSFILSTGCYSMSNLERLCTCVGVCIKREDGCSFHIGLTWYGAIGVELEGFVGRVLKENEEK